MKKTILFAFLAVAALAGIWIFRAELQAWISPREHGLVLYGNADDRQLELAFLISERIAELKPEEGTVVKKGDFLGSLETVRLKNDIAAAEAEVASGKAELEAAEALYEKSKNGSRAEDVAIARAGNAAIAAKIRAAEADYKRQTGLRTTEAVSAQTQEAAEAEYLFLKSGLDALRSYLNKLVAGERAEDIAAAKAKVGQARAGLARAEAELAIRKQRLTDAKLYAPCDGIIRNRLLEPGELAGPQNPVLTLAVVSPKWVRVYLPETLLTKIKSGDKAAVRFDGAEKTFDGWVGFISPSAEFTPKNIETPELRTNLVYEVRVFVDDPENNLKLGAPASVSFPGVMIQ